MASDQDHQLGQDGRAVVRNGRFKTGASSGSAAVTRFGCSVFGHEWMRNGGPLRRGDSWLGAAPDWQKCLRCGLWELVSEPADIPPYVRTPQAGSDAERLAPQVGDLVATRERR